MTSFRSSCSSLLVGSLLAVSTLCSHAGIVALPNTLVSTNGAIEVYETSLGVDSTYYDVNIVNEPSSLSIAGLAVSFNVPGLTPGTGGDLFPTFSPTLGSTDGVSNGSGLDANTYHKDSWSSLSSIPFEDAFGSTDNGFIWISGANPITTANDVDSAFGLNTNDSIAFRHNIPNSQFVAFGSGGSIIGGSLIPEPSTGLLAGLAGLGLVILRRRRAVA